MGLGLAATVAVAAWGQLPPAFTTSRLALSRPRSVACGAFPVSLSPQKALELGIETVPFGDGGADLEHPRPKVYTHGPCRSSHTSKYIVPGRHWRDAAPGSPERQAVQDKALEVLRQYGFVIIEHFLDPQEVGQMEAVAARHLDEMPDGFMTQPLRANRTQLHLPFKKPWANDWLVRNDLVLDLVSRYVCNNMAGGRTEEQQQWSWVEWVTAGAEMDWFRSPERGPVPGDLLNAPPSGCTSVGNAGELGPWLGRVMVTKTPPFAPPQKRHRDIILPGPAAQLTIQVALTQLVANNGALGYVPGSHLMQMPGYEVVCNPPLGSILLYDSFVEHRGLENTTPRDRYAMYYEFETRGIFGGYSDEHFGDEAVAHTLSFRQFVDPPLRQRVYDIAEQQGWEAVR